MGRRLTDVVGGFLHVANWREFQHYKDRNPAWIKLHKKILDNPDYQRLPLASRALAPMLWLLASEHPDGIIPWSPEDIGWRLRTTAKDVMAAVEPLIEKGFFVIVAPEQSASTPLALMEHPAIPEKRREETEEEREKEALKSALGDWIPTKKWEQFVEMRQRVKAPITDHGKYLAMLELKKLRASGQDPGAVLDQSVLKSWKGLFPVSGGSNGKRESVFERMAEELDQKDRNGLPHV